MPTGGRADQTYYFSYEAGPAHVISISSFYDGGYGANSALTKWLVSDLAAINRAATPWVLVSLHAPWYNSNTAHQGDGEGMRAALEPMLLKAGVNAIFTGHVHAYERSHPVANNQIVADGEGIVHFVRTEAHRPPRCLSRANTLPAPTPLHRTSAMRAPASTRAGSRRPRGPRSTRPSSATASSSSRTRRTRTGRGTATRIRRRLLRTITRSSTSRTK